MMNDKVKKTRILQAIQTGIIRRLPFQVLRSSPDKLARNRHSPWWSALISTFGIKKCYNRCTFPFISLLRRMHVQWYDVWWDRGTRIRTHWCFFGFLHVTCSFRSRHGRFLQPNNPAPLLTRALFKKGIRPKKKKNIVILFFKNRWKDAVYQDYNVKL